MVGVGPVVAGRNAGHIPHLRAVLPERHFPVAARVRIPDVGHDALRVVHGRGVGGEAERRAAGGAEHLLGRVGADLVVGGLVGRFVILVGNGAARNLVHAVSVRRAVGAEGRGPPRAAGGSVDVFEDLLAVAGVDVLLLVVRVPDHDVRFGELREQVEHPGVIHVAFVRFARAAAEGHVGAEDYQLVLRHVRQVLTEPFELLVGDAALVVARRGAAADVEDVVHRDDVGVAAVERVVARSELRFEVGGGLVVRSLGLQVVVVADGLEDRQVAVGHRLLHVAPQVGCVEDDVAERDAVHGAPFGLERFDRRLDVGNGLVDVTADVGRAGALRVGDAEQREVGFGSGQRLEHEVVAVGDVLVDDFGIVQRIVVRRGVDFVPCRRAVPDEARLLVADHLIDAVGVGLHAVVAVRHHHALHGVARRVGHQSVEGRALAELRAVKLGLDAGFAALAVRFVVAARQQKRGRHAAE